MKRKNMAKINFVNKVAVNENTNIPDVNKCKASDLNEIKEVVNQNNENVGNPANLSTTSKNVVGAINELDGKIKKIKLVNLYENANGSYSDITLSEKITNYDYLIIDYITNDGKDYQNSQMVTCEENKMPCLSYWFTDGNLLNIKMKIVKLSSKKILNINNKYSDTQLAPVISLASVNHIAITRVRGLKIIYS